MEFVFRHLLVVFSVMAGGAATAFDDSLCMKIGSCVTPEIHQSYMDQTKFCPLWPQYLACIDKYKAYCKPDRAKQLASTLELYENKGKTCPAGSASRREVNSIQCTQLFANCVTPAWQAIKEKNDNNEERCKLAPQLIGCMEAAVEQCGDLAPESLREMRTQLEKFRTNLQCNSGSQLTFSVGQVSFGVLVLLIRWLHY